MKQKQVDVTKFMLSEPVPGEVPQTHWAWYQKTIDAVARPGTKVDFVTLKKGYTKPTTPYTETYNTLGMVERAYEAEKKGYDAFLIGCAYDPGLRESRALVDIPVVAPLESGVLLASTLGYKFSIIALDPCAVPIYEDRVRVYGLANKLLNVRYPPGLNGNTAFEMMFDGKHGEFVDLLTAEMSKAVKEDGTEVLLVGCTIAATVLTMHGVHEVEGAPVVDLIAAEVKMAEAMVDLKRAYGILVCKASIYQRPPPEWEKEIPILFE